jgi:hypothetical protein
MAGCFYEDTGSELAREYGDCGCMQTGPDGFEDLILLFEKDELFAVLAPIADGETRSLTLSGRTKGLQAVSGLDCARLISSESTRTPMHSSAANITGILGNAPNPFNASSVVSYSLAAGQHVRLSVFDLLGHRVATLIDAFQPAGIHTVTWSGADRNGQPVATGIYFCRMEANGRVDSHKMSLIK